MCGASAGEEVVIEPPRCPRPLTPIELRKFDYSGLDPNLSLQAAIFGQRRSEYNYRLENYGQKINGLVSNIAKANADATGYRDRLEVAANVEKMRRDLSL